MIGAQLGPWRLLAQLGVGGAGAVWLVEDAMGRRAALKVLDGRLDPSDEHMQRFMRELDSLSRVDHPRLVRALGPLGTAETPWGPVAWFPMTYVRGRSLAQALQALGRLAPADALRVAIDAADGLAAAHAVGVLHRDVKSGNILVDQDGRAVLCDLGLAHAADRTRMTRSGALLGTPAYVAPEVVLGQPARPESDVYGLGVVLYEALTGSLPFQAETALALARLHVDQKPEPPSTRRPDLPKALDAVVLQALAKKPEERFATAKDMGDALRAVAKKVAPEAVPPAGGGDGLTGHVREHNATAGAALEAEATARGALARQRAARVSYVVLGLLGLLVLALTTNRSNRPRRPPPQPGAAPASATSEAPPATEAAPLASPVAPRPTAKLHLRSGQTLEGTLEALDDTSVRLRIGEEAREVPRADVTAIELGQ
jgi:hypothetical protein